MSSKGKSQHAIVIGAGIAGLAVALRLRALNYEVTVFEAADKVGGKLGEVKSDGFRWDAGPSLFTMPHLVDELFELLGEDANLFFQYQKQQLSCHYFWEDGTFFQAPVSNEEFAKQAAEKFDESAAKISSYLQRSIQKYQLTAPVFLDQSLHRFDSYWNKKTWKAFLNSHRLDIHQSLHALNRKQFKNPKLVQLFDRFATYNGSSPYQTPAIMSMIPSLEMHWGTFFPKGGMRSIVNSLYELAVRKGVKFHLNEAVESIIHQDGMVHGIQSSKSSYEADTVISNMDVNFTYRRLLKDVKPPKKHLQQQKSSSALIFYWGINRQFKELGLHNIFFSEDYEGEFNAIFKEKKIHVDPTVYVNISSKEQPQDAPNGMENWFVMINVPANYGQDWKKLQIEARQAIIQKLNRCLNVDLTAMIIAENTLDPILIEQKTSSHLGALYGTSSNSKFAAFLRHPNKSAKLKHLYFCGGSVHPGGGIPLCLKSAKIVADLIQKN